MKQEEYERVQNEWYAEYQKLGGKENRKEYDEMREIFEDHTLDIFVHGSMNRYKSREEAWIAAQNEMNVSDEEINKIFSSIDNVSGYT